MENREFLVCKVIQGEVPQKIMETNSLETAATAVAKLARKERFEEVLYFVSSHEVEFSRGMVFEADAIPQIVQKTVAALFYFNPWAYHDLMLSLSMNFAPPKNLLVACDFAKDEDPHWNSRPDQAALFIQECVDALNLSPGLPDELLFVAEATNPYEDLFNGFALTIRHENEYQNQKAEGAWIN
jgi:hypothetical protein